MHLKLLLPGETLIDTAVTKVVAEGEDGQFCLLPRHVDWVAALVPGLLLYTTSDEVEHPVAVDTGTLVKCGPEVLVSVRAAVTGLDLESLRATVELEFRQLSEQDRQVRSALARLEASALRRFVELR
jgi:F-type H+-transporting ATPase subunit epsilon